MKTNFIKSFDNTNIFCTFFDDVENPKGIVMMSHGMGEHSQSIGYCELAKVLNQNGYLVFADDHRAHGHTESDENRGYHKGDIFKDTLKDILYFSQLLKDKYSLPIYYFGHSYGSILGETILCQDNLFSGVALSGCGYSSPTISKIEALLILPLMWFKKDMRLKCLAPMSDFLASFKFRGEKGFGIWLTRDKTLQDLTKTDKLIGAPISVAFIKYMLFGSKSAFSKQSLKNIKKDIPVALFGGSMDMSSNYSKNFEKLYDVYNKCGIKHLQTNLYKGARHNLLNEINRDEVYCDILKFFDGCQKKDYE